MVKDIDCQDGQGNICGFGIDIFSRPINKSLWGTESTVLKSELERNYYLADCDLASADILVEP